MLGLSFARGTRAYEPLRVAAPGCFELGGVRSHIGPELLSRLASGATLAEGPHQEVTVCAPYTGAILGNFLAGREADVDLAVKRARAAQPAWAARTFADRGKFLLRFHDLLLDRQHEVLDLIQLENGKARRHAFEEVLDTAVVSRYYARAAARLLRSRRRKGALPLLTRTLEIHSPVGVVGFISPWNFPLTLGITDAIAALMAGNTVVVRPDSQGTFTALWALALLREAGLPRDVFQLVLGEGGVIGPAMTDRVDYLMFTGSTRTGRVVARNAAARLIGCSLELGGKNSMLVLPDADLDDAVEGAVRGCFVGAGQVCVSIERIYIHQSVFDRFVGRFAQRTRNLRLGAALNYSVEVGSLTTEDQVETVDQHVRDAVEKGAKLLAGGRRRPELGPFFFEPTILSGVGEGMMLFDEETFGPVVSVFPYSTEDEAIAQVNATRYGLNASVWTRNTREGIRVARRIRAGSVNVNESYAAAWGSVDSPTGGMKESGIGRRHGAEGILKFTEAQTVAVQRLLPIAPAPGIDPAWHALWMSRMLKLLRHTRLLD